jgi:hypothetical protein
MSHTARQLVEDRYDLAEMTRGIRATYAEKYPC